MPDSPVSTLTIPCREAYLAPAVDFVQALAHNFGFSHREAKLLSLAVEEALNNVMKHGFGGESDEPISLEIQEGTGELIITIKEKGLPFDPSSMAENGLADDEAHGLGLKLMGSAVDEVQFSSLGRDGKATRLVKRLPQERIDKLPGETVGERGVGSTSGAPVHEGDITFTVRPPKPEEAIEISRLAWAAYGYGYEEYIYHPSRINQAIAEGTLVSWVAVADGTDEIMGHVALKQQPGGSPLPEIGVAFVNPRFRRTGVFHALNEACIDHARTQGSKGYFTQAVTGHAASQSSASRYGLTPCALHLGLLPEGVSFRGLAALPQKESAISLMYAFDRDMRDVYAPEKHRDMLETILSWQGIPRTFREPLPPAHSGSACHVRASIISGGLNSAVMEVECIGADTDTEIRRLLRGFCKDRVDGIYLSLPLDDPAAPALCDACEAMGFFFSGMTPFGLPFGEDGRDAIQFQYLNNLVLDPTRLQLHAEESRNLLEYVVEQGRHAGAL